MALRTDGKPSIQLDQEQAISVRELDTTANPPLQHNQLISERSVLCLKSVFDLNGEAKRDKQRQNRAIIAAEVRRFGRVINTDGVLGTHSGLPDGSAARASWKQQQLRPDRQSSSSLTRLAP